MGLRQDDSSIDSFADRELLSSEVESSPKASKSHLSPTNLSRDSGLTLSDTQLYDEETGLTLSDTQVYDEEIGTKHASVKQFQEEFQYPDALSIDFNQNTPTNFIDPQELAAPPKKVSVKKSRKPHAVHSSSLDKLAAMKHSASTTQMESRPRLDWCKHMSFDKQNSFDSLGEEAGYKSADLHKLVPKTDMGTLVRSESGNLFFNDLPVITNHYSPVTSDPCRPSAFKPQHRFLRQSSITETMPPVSPQSPISQLETLPLGQLDESLNSTVTESPPVNSTVTESPPPVPPKMKSLGLSQSTLNLAEFSPPELDLTTRDKSLCSGKFHEAEEIHLGRRPQFKVSIPEEHSCSPVIRRLQLLTGSPPPNVILKTLAGSKQELTNQFKFSKHLETLDLDSHGKSNLSSHFSHYSKSFKKSAASSKDGHGIVTCSDICRPDKPPSYQQAVQRNFMLKHKIPVDITREDTEKQREASARAKALYEQSLQLYNQQGQYGSSHQHNSSTLPWRSEQPKVARSLYQQDMSASESHVLPTGMTKFKPQQLHLSDVLEEQNSVSQHSDSSSNSSMVASNLKHSDSFGARSDISNTSNVTVSSVTSSDSEECEDMYNHEETVANIFTEGQELSENILNKKTPKQLYLESIKEFEMMKQKQTPSHWSSLSKSFSNLSLPTMNSDTVIEVPSGQSSLLAGSVNLHKSQGDEDKCGQSEKPSSLEGQTNNTGISSKHHEKFLKARSYFHQPNQPSLIKHSASSPSIPMLFIHEKLHRTLQVVSGEEHTVAPWAGKSAAVSLRVGKPALGKDIPESSAANAVPANSAANPVPTYVPVTAKSKKKPELPWSVKDLKSKWDNSNSIEGASSWSPLSKNQKPLQNNLHGSKSGSDHGSKSGSDHEGTSAHTQITYI